MDRIVTKNEFCGEAKIGDCTVQRPLCADELALLESTQNNLQQALDRFSDACCVSGMKISTAKTETCQTNKAVLSLGLWSTTKTVIEIHVPRGLIHK